jgi:hypothetical protein
MKPINKPNWVLLYLTVPVMIGLLVVDALVPGPVLVHRIVEFGIVLAGFGLMAVWVQANAGAIQDEEFAGEHWVLVSPGDTAGTEAFERAGGLDMDLEEQGHGSYPALRARADPNTLPWVEMPHDVSNPYHLKIDPDKGRNN